ncbi:MAG: twin-arginine translocation pathway signal protein, partial [Bacteroidota bacterium]
KNINGWAENPDFNKAEYFDVEAELLGQRQLSFLNDWVADWSDGATMKCLLSQTIFATVATLPNEAISDVVVPKLRVMKKGDYAPNDRPTQDMDSNGWPKQGRDRALRILRKGFAFHLAGDQHLGSSGQYGVDDWGDAGYFICVPSVANIWPRRWFPPEAGNNRQPDAPKYTGDFLDGFGNKVTVATVSNPVFTNKKPAMLYDRATGYGIVKFKKSTRQIEFANWPREVDPATPGARPYDGWPITVSQMDNYGRKAVAYLPTLQIEGLKEAVLKIRASDTKELVYALRLNEATFRPGVFTSGRYDIHIGEGAKMQSFEGIQSLPPDQEKILQVVFE